MQITHKTFVDLCIMSGCDYNTNIPGYGTVKSYNLLQKHKTIDNLSDKLDLTCLKHVRCRELFSYSESNTLTSDELFLDLNKSCISTSRDYLEMAGVAGQLHRLVGVCSNLKDPKDGFVETLAIKSASDYSPPKIIETKFVNLVIV